MFDFLLSHDRLAFLAFLELESNCTDFFIILCHLGVKEEIETVVCFEMGDDGVKTGKLEHCNTSDPFNRSDGDRRIAKLRPRIQDIYTRIAKLRPGIQSQMSLRRQGPIRITVDTCHLNGHLTNFGKCPSSAI